MTGNDRDAERDIGAGARAGADRSGLIQHGGGFLFSGGLAFLVDAGVLSGLTAIGLDPFSARLFAIAVAMVVAWASHRRFTFAVRTQPTLREFARYAAVAWTAAAINYAIYAGILLVWPQTPPVVALILATLVAMTFSYLGMRFGVFHRD